MSKRFCLENTVGFNDSHKASVNYNKDQRLRTERWVTEAPVALWGVFLCRSDTTMKNRLGTEGKLFLRTCSSKCSHLSSHLIPSHTLQWRQENPRLNTSSTRKQNGRISEHLKRFINIFVQNSCGQKGVWPLEWSLMFKPNLTLPHRLVLIHNVFGKYVICF